MPSQLNLGILDPLLKNIALTPWLSSLTQGNVHLSVPDEVRKSPQTYFRMQVQSNELLTCRRGACDA